MGRTIIVGDEEPGCGQVAMGFIGLGMLAILGLCGGAAWLANRPPPNQPAAPAWPVTLPVDQAENGNGPAGAVPLAPSGAAPQPVPVKVQLFTVLGPIQLSEAVEIIIGDQTVTWNLTRQAPQVGTTVTLPSQGTYPYTIRTTSAILERGKAVEYYGSGKGEVAVREGSRLLFYREGRPDPLTKTYQGTLKPQ